MHLPVRCIRYFYVFVFVSNKTVHDNCFVVVIALLVDVDTYRFNDVWQPKAGLQIQLIHLCISTDKVKLK